MQSRVKFANIGEMENNEFKTLFCVDRMSASVTNAQFKAACRAVAALGGYLIQECEE